MSRFRREIAETQRKVEQLQNELHTLYAALTVRDPQFGDTLDAYTGLRKQVAYAANARRSLVVLLAEMHKALGHAKEVEDLRPKVEEWMRQAGVEAVSDPSRVGLYDFPEGGTGSRIEVERPAYVARSDGLSDTVVSMGTARRVEEVVVLGEIGGDGEVEPPGSLSESPLEDDSGPAASGEPGINPPAGSRDESEDK